MPKPTMRALAVLLALTALPAATLAATVPAGGGLLAATALATPFGGKLTITGLRLQGDTAASTLDLERAQVWRDGAQLEVHTAAGVEMLPPPDIRTFRGEVAGAPGSSVILTVQPDGTMKGIANRGGAYWTLGSAAALVGPSAAAIGTSPTALASQAVTAAELAEAGRARKPCGTKPNHSHTHANPIPALSKTATPMANNVSCWWQRRAPAVTASSVAAVASRQLCRACRLGCCHWRTAHSG